MINDPELKAMSKVLIALQNLDADTRSRVVDWVLAKLKSSHSSGESASSAKRGPKPGSKRSGNKRGRKSQKSPSLISPLVGVKRGPKPGKKRGPKPGSKTKGKRGRPPGNLRKSSDNLPINSAKPRRGRPRKSASEVRS